MKRHQGKSVVVTGGGSGIGRSCVERFVEDGARVVIADVQLEKAKNLASRLGPSAIAVRADVTNEVDMTELVAATLDFAGRLDVWVNNAGAVLVRPLVDTELSDWQRLFKVNVEGVFLGSRAAARQMIAQGCGKHRVAGVIVNAASTASRRAAAGVSAYCATKAAVELLSSALAIELAPHRIRVNCTAPGFIRTDMWRDLASGIAASSGGTAEQVLEQFAAAVPWKRFGEPAEVAATVSWLASDEAEYINGQCISMNGGEMLF